MTSSWPRVRATFERALDLPPAARPAWVARELAGDAVAQHEVLRLLAAESAPPEFLAPPHAAPPPPRRVGAFRLVSPLASGGMGTVWIAEQDEPQRRVAVKLMHEGLVAAAHAARFRAEGEILARLQHPGIAQVFGAGVEDSGVAWFAMELLADARPITEALRAAPLAARLTAFVAACDAVQHAHERGVIHRDLKPANILRLADGAVKVIDFGIARVLDADHTQATREGELLGTLAYMSPEQVEGRDTDVRTDVYGLGVVLYELVTGERPFDLAGQPITVACRTIVERDAPTVRSRAPALPRELDWIVGRALRKDPTERYAGVAALAEDVRRLHRHEPVTAAPPGIAYRARKFVRRHRAFTAAAAVVLAVSIGAFATTAAALVRTQRAEAAERQGRRDAEAASQRAEAALAFLLSVFESVHPAEQGRDVRMVDALARAAATFDRELAAAPTIRAELGRTIGLALHGLGDLDQADAHLAESLAVHERCFGTDHAKTARLQVDVAALAIDRGRLDDAEAALARAAATLDALPADDPLRTACDLQRGNLLRARGERSAAITVLEPAVERLRRDAPDARQTLVACNLLAGVRQAEGDLDGAEALYRTAHDGFAARGEAESPDALVTTNNLLTVQNARGARAETVPEWERLIAARRRLLGEDHPTTIGTVVNFASVLFLLGRVDEAAMHFEAALAARSRTADDTDATVQTLLSGLAKIASVRGDLTAAARYGERVLAARRATFGDDHDLALLSATMLADVLRLQGAHDRALDLLRDTERRAAAASPPQWPHHYRARMGIAHTLLAKGVLDEAERLLLACRDEFARAEAASPLKGRLQRPEPVLAQLYRALGRDAEAEQFEAAR